MRLRTWPILAVSFGTLIVLIALSGGGALRRAQEIFAEISTLHGNYRRSERVLSQVRSEIHLSGVLVRDYLLDPSNIAAGRYREELLSMRASMAGELDELSRTMSPEDAPKLASLRKELDGYWGSLDPLFEWTPQQKMSFSALFLRKQVLPRREAALSIAHEIAGLNQANLERQRHLVGQKQSELPRYVTKMLAITILLGLLVAAGTMFRTSRLERRATVERRKTELAEQELRRLSQELVRAQEEERRSISRELHDEVGQMLTALRMELRSLEQLRQGPAELFQAHLDDSKALSEKALRVVRDLAMGLRPSMLDDLGLGPAVEWQGRDSPAIWHPGDGANRRHPDQPHRSSPHVRLQGSAGSPHQLRASRPGQGDPDHGVWRRRLDFARHSGRWPGIRCFGVARSRARADWHAKSA